MNFEKILDISTPFNEEKLALFDQIVMIFYTTKSNEEVKILKKTFLLKKIKTKFYFLIERIRKQFT